MRTIEMGSMVRINAPDWYAEPEFQAWFNQGLGKGLATWQNASEPLKPSSLDAEQCVVLADSLAQHVINTNPFFEPCNTGPFEMYESEMSRLAKANETLAKLHEALTLGGSNEGIAAEEALALTSELKSYVLDADVMFDPGKGAPDEEHDMLDLAKSTLDAVYQGLSNLACGEDAYTYGDCFVGVDPGIQRDNEGELWAEGTDSDMPEKYWKQIVEAANELVLKRGRGNGLHILVWLSPVE